MLCLGIVLLAEGISTKPEKVNKVKTWPSPKNIKEVQSFLGLTSYYSEFIPHLTTKAQCLHELVDPTTNKTKRKVRPKETEIDTNKLKPRIFECRILHQEAFDALKEALSTAPGLG